MPPPNEPKDPGQTAYEAHMADYVAIVALPEDAWAELPPDVKQHWADVEEAVLCHARS